MSDPLGGWMPGLDPLTGALTLPLWAAGALAAVFVVFCVMALSRAGRDGIVGTVARSALIVVGAVLVWFYLEGTTKQNAAAERRALEARAAMLATRSTVPGSPLACLDAMAGDAVENSCERTLFATPEATASAVSYVAAQIDLFANVSTFVNRGNRDMAPTLASLQRAVETDRFGLVAHVLATRDGCIASRCPALAMMRDASRVTANLAQRTYDLYVVRHSSAWPASAPGPTANAAPSAAPSGGAHPALAGAPSGSPRPELFFPSSDSIPPVNIMTSEPAAPPETTGSAPAPARTPPRRPPQAAQQPKQAPVDLNAGRAAPPAAQ